MQKKIKNGLVITILLMAVIMIFTSCGSETNYPETTTNTEVTDSTCVDTIIAPAIVPLDSNRLVVALEDSIK